MGKRCWAVGFWGLGVGVEMHHQLRPKRLGFSNKMMADQIAKVVRPTVVSAGAEHCFVYFRSACHGE